MSAHTAEKDAGLHAFDLSDGWCHTHRDFCTMSEPPAGGGA